jgi:aspartate/glutamate racemase
MEGPIYPAAFARHGLAMRTPDPGDRARVDAIIFDKPCQGRLLDASRAEYVRVIDWLKREECDGWL